MGNNKIQISQLSLSLKVLTTCFIVTMFIGYGIALLKIIQISGIDINFDQVQTYYNGDEASEGIFLPQSYEALLSVVHVHSLSQPLMFALMALAFCFTSLREKIKAGLITLSFIGMLMGNATPWLIRYVEASLVYLFPISQLMMGPIFFFMGLMVLYESWLITESAK